MRALLASLLVLALTAPGRAEVYREDPRGEGWESRRDRVPELHRAPTEDGLTRARLDGQLDAVDAELHACVPPGHRPIRLRVRITRHDDVVVRTGLSPREREVHACLEVTVLRAVIPLLGLRHPREVTAVGRLLSPDDPRAAPEPH